MTAVVGISKQTSRRPGQLIGCCNHRWHQRTQKFLQANKFLTLSKQHPVGDHDLLILLLLWQTPWRPSSRCTASQLGEKEFSYPERL